VRGWTRISIALVALCAVVLVAVAATSGGDAGATPRGLITHRKGAFAGYTLYAPLELRRTVLIDMDGNVVHQWRTGTRPGLMQYLLEDGSLLRAGNLERKGTFARGQGAGGRVELLDWDGTVQWRFDLASDDVMQHHDIQPLPNGNVLVLAWERKTAADAIAHGRDPKLLPDKDLWPDSVVEYSPTEGRVVWEWHVWDHLVQDHDPAQADYGVVADHPEKIDVNFVLPGNNGDEDWNHANAVTYNPVTDEVMISSRSFSELWVIDHSTTTAEAAGPAGDLRFRVGNPAAYGRGTHADQELFVQHDPEWIPADSPGAGDITVFSNGLPKVRQYSTVEQIHPITVNGQYVLGDDGRFAATVKRVVPTREADRRFAAIISSAQRLPNGNTLVDYGSLGFFVETKPDGTIVWEYENPRYTVRKATPARTGAGFVIEPWWTFRVERYAPGYPGLAALAS
jgi:Arylsulfotransferase (ASST)